MKPGTPDYQYWTTMRSLMRDGGSDPVGAMKKLRLLSGHHPAKVLKDLEGALGN